MEEELIVCPIRKRLIKKTPEEAVRYELLRLMIEELGYPASRIVVEHSLRELPHLRSSSAIPRRRIDILAYTPAELKPCLLIECKEKCIQESALRQILGYNYHIGASFLGLVSQETCQIFTKEGKLVFSEMPRYECLI